MDCQKFGILSPKGFALQGELEMMLTSRFNGKVRQNRLTDPIVVGSDLFLDGARPP
jgi:hypothetical protein